MNNNDVKEKILPIGGQAVLEGVMMRSPDKVATAVRKPDGEIVMKIEEYKGISEKHKWLNIPFIRGAVTLIEVMILGIRHLNFSADVAIKAEDEEKKKKGEKVKEQKKSSGNIGVIFSVVFALGVGMALFFAFPLWVTTHLFNIEKDAMTFNFLAGSIRLTLFLVYIIAISFMKDIKRLFQYHGAEHMAVFAFESKDELTVENTKRFSTFHPRCGTSFLVMVMLVSVIFFSFLDTFTIYLLGDINFTIRLLTHLPFVGLVGGISYEIIRLSAKKIDNPFVKLLITPGLWLQRITTKNPDDDMLEVAICALKAARGEDISKFLKKEEPETELIEQ
jgi:uncharacterized protein YqhQ